MILRINSSISLNCINQIIFVMQKCFVVEVVGFGAVCIYRLMPTFRRNMTSPPSGTAEDRAPVVQSVVRHYTDWSTPAPMEKYMYIFPPILRRVAWQLTSLKSSCKVLKVSCGPQLLPVGASVGSLQVREAPGPHQQWSTGLRRFMSHLETSHEARLHWLRSFQRNYDPVRAGRCGLSGRR
jgi:hypothetical protein